MRRVGASRWEQGLAAALPRSCAGCDRPNLLWCQACYWHVASLRARLDPPPEQAPALLAIGGEHHGPLRGAVLLFKRHEHKVATRQVVRLLASALALLRQTLHIFTDDRPVLIVPVPASSRRSRRGPTTVIADRLARGSSSVRCAPLLRTAVRRQPQKGLNAAARARNVADSFTLVRRPPAEPNTLVLLDDVVTTGATLAEAHRALNRQGYAVSAALCISRAVPGS